MIHRHVAARHVDIVGGLVGQHHLVPEGARAAVVHEEIHDAVLRQQAVEEIELALVIAYRIAARRRVRTDAHRLGQPDDIGGHRGEDVEAGLVLDEMRCARIAEREIGRARGQQDPHPLGTQRQPRGIDAPGKDARRKVADRDVELDQLADPLGQVGPHSGDQLQAILERLADRLASFKTQQLVIGQVVGKRAQIEKMVTHARSLARPSDAEAGGPGAGPPILRASQGDQPTLFSASE